MGHLRTAPPPIHSVSFVVIFLAICLKSLPSMSSIDEVATIDAFTNTATDFVGLKSVAITRLLFAFFGVATSIYDYFSESLYFPPVTVNTKYHPRSKLVCVPFELKGWKKNIFFTNLIWNMLTVFLRLWLHIMVCCEWTGRSNPCQSVAVARCPACLRNSRSQRVPRGKRCYLCFVG